MFPVVYDWQVTHQFILYRLSCGPTNSDITFSLSMYRVQEWSEVTEYHNVKALNHGQSRQWPHKMVHNHCKNSTVIHRIMYANTYIVNMAQRQIPANTCLHVWRHFVNITQCHVMRLRDSQKTDQFPIRSKLLRRPHNCPCRQQWKEHR